MTRENVYFEIHNDTVFRRTVTKNSAHKVQVKERIGGLSDSLSLNFGDVYLSQNEKRYLQIVDKDEENKVLAYRVYEPNTSKNGFVSTRIYTSPAKFRADLCSNRFELY